MKKDAIRHAGLFNFKNNVTNQEKDDFFVALKALSNIPGVQELEISRQISPKNNFQFAFSMCFDSNELMTAYASNPKHDDFVQHFWLTFVADFMEVDTQIML